ncbi:hypothetical protein HY480_04670 [Candidatus Uhrbacteria bacterium]|nr:hypothetical protein [Candidatus Uhrbacteria bacterium]
MAKGESERCGQCGNEFATYVGLRAHVDAEHVLRVVREDPLVVRMDCGDDPCCEGDVQARFVNGVADLRRRYPNRRFHFVPLAGQWYGQRRPYDPAAHALGVLVSPEPPISAADIVFDVWLAVEDPVEGGGVTKEKPR